MEYGPPRTVSPLARVSAPESTVAAVSVTPRAGLLTSPVTPKVNAGSLVP
jgi:hypothetical protein